MIPTKYESCSTRAMLVKSLMYMQVFRGCWFPPRLEAHRWKMSFKVPVVGQYVLQRMTGICGLVQLWSDNHTLILACHLFENVQWTLSSKCVVFWEKQYINWLIFCLFLCPFSSVFCWYTFKRYCGICLVWNLIKSLDFATIQEVYNLFTFPTNFQSHFGQKSHKIFCFWY